MATRRLLILMLAVLAISTLGAALIAPRPEPEQATTTTTTDQARRAGGTPAAPGRLIEASVKAGARRAETIRLRPGDQLELTVRSRTAGQVEIARFGMLEDVGPSEPARFSLLVGKPAHFEVRLAGSGRPVASVEVAPPDARRRARDREADRAAR